MRLARSAIVGLLMVVTITFADSQKFVLKQAYHKTFGRQIFADEQQLTFIRPQTANGGFVSLQPSPSGKLYLAEFREFGQDPEFASVGLLESNTRNFRFVVGERLFKETDQWVRAATMPRWIGNTQFRVQIIQRRRRQSMTKDDKRYSQIVSVKTKGICPTEQRIASLIRQRIGQDRQLRGMKILWVGSVEGSDEIQSYVGYSSSQFPQWWLRYKISGRFIEKQLIYGE